jgi:hypothetical protein
MHTMKHKFYMQCGTRSLEYFHLLLELKLLQLATSLKVVVVGRSNFFALTFVHWSFEARDLNKLQNNFKLACYLKIKAQINNNNNKII